MKIAMLGAGAFGQALGKVLTDNQHEVKYYDPILYPEVNLDAVTYEAETIVIAVPSLAINALLENYPDRLKKVPTILATKGLLSADVFADFTQFSVLSGPAFASEIIEGKPATLTSSSPVAMGLFHNDQINIELCEDLKGILLCGALKNIYAIGSGYYSDSENMTAAFIQHAHSEMKTYLADHDCDPQTAELGCGLGDLILTCTCETSRNFRCGKMLAEGRSIDEVLDKLKTVEGLSALLNVETEKYQLLRKIKELAGYQN
jgi:glycerol-3-phosphate dehydrogenase (NAD(P)+)